MRSANRVILDSLREPPLSKLREFLHHTVPVVLTSPSKCGEFHYYKYSYCKWHYYNCLYLKDLTISFATTISRGHGEYENQIFVELLADDGLVLLAR